MPAVSRRALFAAAGLAALGLARGAAGQPSVKMEKRVRAAQRAAWAANPVGFDIDATMTLNVDSVIIGPARNPLSQDRRDQITGALSHAAARYREMGFDAPNLPLDGKLRFVINYQETYSAAAGTGPMFRDGESGLDSDHIRMLLSEKTYFVDPDLAVYPRKSDVTAVHELVHAIGWANPTESPDMPEDGVAPVIGEGLPDALALYGLNGFRGVDMIAELSKGEEAHGKHLGLRPWDYPLFLETWPRTRTWLTPRVGDDQKAIRTILGYMTSPFWRYLFEDECPRAGARRAVNGGFRLVPAMLREPFTARDETYRRIHPTRIFVSWLDRYLKAHHPTWKNVGLYRAFPAFIADRIEWPDQRAVSPRRGTLEHPRWLDMNFFEGAQVAELSIDKPDTQLGLKMKPMSGRPVRVRIKGFQPGAHPALTIAAMVRGDVKKGIDNIHIGVRGNVLANGASQARRRLRRWTIDGNPLTKDTGGELVLSVINCAPDPADSREVTIDLYIGLQQALAEGEVTYAPEPVPDPESSRNIFIPPSTRPMTGRRVRAQPGPRPTDSTSVRIPQEDVAIDFFEKAAQMADLATGLSVGGQFAVERRTDYPRKDIVRTIGSTTRMEVDAMARSLSFDLNLPRVEAGQTGALEGGTASVTWYEPAYERFDAIGVSPWVAGETDAVSIEILSSTESSVHGRYRADFAADSRATAPVWRGVVSGDFTIGIQLDEQEDPEPPVEMGGSVTTDVLIAAGRAGRTLPGINDGSAPPARDEPQDPAGEAGDVAGQGAGQGSIRSMDACQVTDADMQRFVKQAFADATPKVQADFLAALRSDPEMARQIICAWLVS